MELMQIVDKFREYIQSSHDLEYRAKTCEKHLIIDFSDFIKFDIDLANSLLDNPRDTIKLFENILNEVRGDDIPIRIRYKNIDKINSCNMRIRDIRTTDYNKMQVITGIIIHISEIYSEIILRRFECPSCGNIINIIQERFQQKKEPLGCGCGRKGRFLEIYKEEIDSQKIVIEEEIESIEGNQQPNKLDVLLQYGLCSPEIEKRNTLGSRVLITGIILSKPKIVNNKITNELEKYMEANYILSLEDKYKEIQISEEDKKMIHVLAKRKDLMEIMIDSYAPHISGYEDVKKAIILQLFGGVTKINDYGKRDRGDFHILLIGDPATGKTQLAKASEPIALKFRYTSGVRSSKAGMTAMVIKDDFVNKWGVQAGAVVLANKGLCVCDEFDKMTDDDRDSLHEAMEEQTITIDKATIHTKLRAETSILACANWKYSRYNPNEPIYSQIDMPDSLISRFDSYFIFIDIPDKERDKQIIHKMLGINYEKVKQQTLNYDLFKKYIIYSKNFNPKISDKLKEKISDLYIQIREQSRHQMDKLVVSITARQADAFRRFTEASARMHLRDATEEDVTIAYELIMASLKSVAFDTSAGVIDIDIIETGMPSSERNLIFNIRNIINDLSFQYNKLIPLSEIYAKFPLDIHLNIEKLLNKMIRSGDIYEPRNGFIAKL